MESQKDSDSSSATSGCSGVTDNPAVSRNVQGTPDILAELRARAMQEIVAIDRRIPILKRNGMYRATAFSRGYGQACIDLIAWLDELAPPSDNTARDTKSSSAGVH